MRGAATLPARMAQKFPNLRDWVRKKLKEKKLTHILVAKRAQKLGYKLSPAFTGTIVNEMNDSVSVKKLQAFAAGLGESEDEVFDIARGKQMADDPKYKASLFALMHREYSALPKEDQAELDPTINLLRKNISERLTDRLRDKPNARN